eukprot:TRINITY_DN925_c0_g1_i3.p1 TRINITY_DN925_c0_g1~~TRINITY_DN925_c0_g1_i3.p1  ORF type:complete len:454 (+),score=122.48 TRINITY_DN925_c0_g1_i3:32-1393(+)
MIWTMMLYSSMLIDVLFQPNFVMKQEIDQLIEEWTPEPLARVLSPMEKLNLRTPTLESVPAATTVVNGKKVVNLVTHNYLGYLQDEELIQVGESTIRKYGLGSCGPRGFYGTFDVHLDIEKETADWYGTNDAILYASPYTTIVSCIPAFVKKQDMLMVDEGVNFAIRKAVEITRCTVYWYRHNDMKHLEELMEMVKLDDQLTGRKLTRRYVITEGVFLESSDIAPLDTIVALKDEYKFRLIMDDTLGVGMLGDHGRGTAEHFGLKTCDVVDIYLAGYDHGLGGTGGFSVGNCPEVVDYQRLNGSGYVFSASLPPYLVTTSTAAIKKLRSDPSVLLTLKENVARFREGLSQISDLVVLGHQEVAVVVVQFATRHPEGRDLEEMALQEIVERAYDSGVLITRAKRAERDTYKPTPSLRLCVSAAHSPEDLDRAVRAIKTAVRKVMGDKLLSPRKK